MGVDKNKGKAVLLLSGGLDSATTAAIAIEEGYTLSALTFSYGQRHEIEMTFAEKLAGFFKIRDHLVIRLPSEIFQSALISDSKIDVPKNRDEITEEKIPVTYVPARNILFLSYALAYAESTGARNIFIGANAVDYSGYPDCRPEFFESYNAMANIGTKSGIMGDSIKIETPLINYKKSEIIKIGLELGVDYSMTHSCYDPGKSGTACGECDSCIIRKKGFRDAGVDDPVRYSIG